MAVVSAAPLVVVGSNTQALVDMFTAATLLPAIAYAGTVLLYAGVVRHIKREQGTSTLATGSDRWLPVR